MHNFVNYIAWIRITWQLRRLRICLQFGFDPCNLGLIPGSGRAPGGEHGYPLQYSCLENSMDRRAWWATVHGFAKRHDGTVYIQPQPPNPSHPLLPPLCTQVCSPHLHLSSCSANRFIRREQLTLSRLLYNTCVCAVQSLHTDEETGAKNHLANEDQSSDEKEL